MAMVMPPAVGDPVVIDGTKYRIRSIEPGPEGDVAQLRTTYGRETATCPVDELLWDRRAGVWRASE